MTDLPDGKHSQREVDRIRRFSWTGTSVVLQAYLNSYVWLAAHDETLASLFETEVLNLNGIEVEHG